jgi:hypothetical protein
MMMSRRDSEDSEAIFDDEVLDSRSGFDSVEVVESNEPPSHHTGGDADR